MEVEEKLRGQQASWSSLEFPGTQHVHVQASSTFRDPSWGVLFLSGIRFPTGVRCFSFWGLYARVPFEVGIDIRDPSMVRAVSVCLGGFLFCC